MTLGRTICEDAVCSTALLKFPFAVVGGILPFQHGAMIRVAQVHDSLIERGTESFDHFAPNR